MPEPLNVCFFVNSGSEANDLALQMAARATGARGVVVTETAYHGNTTAVRAISPADYSLVVEAGCTLASIQATAAEADLSRQKGKR